MSMNAVTVSLLRAGRERSNPLSSSRSTDDCAAEEHSAGAAAAEAVAAEAADASAEAVGAEVKAAEAAAAAAELAAVRGTLDALASDGSLPATSAPAPVRLRRFTFAGFHLNAADVEDFLAGETLTDSFLQLLLMP